ncbi:MAG: ABC transporter ATP-binding protein [Alkalicoccus sp.]|nr:MAG: ABC transporter ATP-binding protein [Alkalicoccus sp.]
MIEFDKVSKQFPDGTKAVDNISFRVEPGELFVLIGPSGCGKTTTMKMINRLIDTTSGKISINDENILHKDLHKLRWEIGYVLQQIALFPHMTIAENIAVVPELKKWDKKKTEKRIDELMEMTGLDPATYRNRLPKELSGGQQQRVGVIRALAGDPDILLMDEPFSALDPISREQLQKDIASLQRDIKKTIVFVTHDMDEALQLGDRIAVMQEGKIVQMDTPDNLLEHPADDFVKSFIGDRKDMWEAGAEAAMVPAPEQLPPNLPSVKAELSLREAVRVLQESEEEQAAVVKENKIAGVITNKSVLAYLLPGDRKEGEKK